MANVITYGTFDLFHVGHLRLLQRARSAVRKELLYHGVPIVFANLNEEQQRKLNVIPAMVYHGVNTEEAVLMRMNSIPRSVAVPLGKLYKERTAYDSPEYYSASNARAFVKELRDADWRECAPRQSSMTGGDYRKIWGVLSGDFSQGDAT